MRCSTDVLIEELEEAIKVKLHELGVKIFLTQHNKVIIKVFILSLNRVNSEVNPMHISVSSLMSKRYIKNLLRLHMNSIDACLLLYP